MASPCCIRLNVGGKLFLTTADTLRSLPDTRLGRLASDDSLTDQPDGELFFDRNPKIINSLLDLYRTGELHLPRKLCARTVEQELEFWEIPGELIRECCFGSLREHEEDARIGVEIEEFLSFPYDVADDWQRLETTGRIWLMMERSKLCLASKIWGLIYFTVVAVSAVVYILDTVMSFRCIKPRFQEEAFRKNISLSQALSNMTQLTQFQVTLRNPWIEMASILTFVFFLLEFVVRFLVCPSKRFFVRQTRNWLEAFLLVHNAVDVLLQKVYLEGRVYFPDSAISALMFFYSFDTLKMLRILYVVKDCDILKILLLTTKACLKELALLATCLLSLAILYGTALYVVELLTEQFTFHTIPHAMWYAVVTMTTVGYGDVVPAGTSGRMLATLCMFSGMVTLALPVAVVSSKFSRYHDNLASRTQRRARLAYSKDRPEVLLRDEVTVKKEGERCHYRLSRTEEHHHDVLLRKADKKSESCDPHSLI